MKTLAFVFSYNRPVTLRACLHSLFANSEHIPDEVIFIDDGSGAETVKVLKDVAQECCGMAEIALAPKGINRGLSDSANYAMAITRNRNPDFVFFIEGDYIFLEHGLDTVMEVLTNTPEGDTCLGIVGYDHPAFRSPIHREHIFPCCMKAQVGEDNVNRAALHRPEIQLGGLYKYSLELASNTCWTSYLNWRNIQKVASEFPELNDLLDQACAPRDNPNYPDSGKYKAQRTVDDGMLSHAISLCWNRYAIKHGIDRERFGAWLNILPSVAEHRSEGGTNFG